MARFSNDETNLLTKYIQRDDLLLSLREIREFMENLWKIGAPLIIRDYTDHGEAHCKRVANYATKLISANKGEEFSHEELYLLLAGIYLHDIGMQCDISRFPEIKIRAEKLGAKFDVELNATTASGYSIDQQKAIRRNHNYITAAWIEYALQAGETELCEPIKSVPQELILDLMDICKYHSQLKISECEISFAINSNNRKRLVAALLRFSDELDISNNRVDIDILKNFSFDPENSIYWYLHSLTKVIFQNESTILIKIVLSPDDMESYGSLIQKIFFDTFKEKNAPVLDVLARERITIHIDNESGVTEYQYAKSLDPEIIDEVKKLSKKTDNSSSKTPNITQNHSSMNESMKQVIEKIENEESKFQDLDKKNGTIMDLDKKQKENEEILKFIRDRAVNDEEAEVRIVSMEALIQISPEDPDTFIVIKDRMFNDKNFNVKKKAMEILAKNWYEDPETLNLIKDLATNDVMNVLRMDAIKILADKWSEDPETFKFIRDRAKNDKLGINPQFVRGTALVALANKWLNDPETLFLIKDRLFNDNDNYVRSTAIRTLANKWFEDPETLKLIKDIAANDTDVSKDVNNVRITSLWLLADKWFADPETHILIKDRALKDTTNFVKINALRLLARKWFEDPETFELIKDRVLNDGEDEVKNASMEILVEKYRADPKIRIIIRDIALNDKSKSVRSKAIQLLPKFSLVPEKLL